MDCNGVRKEILSFIYDELEPSEAEAVKSHIDGCAECHAEWRARRSICGALDRWPDVVHRVDAEAIIGRGRTVPVRKRAVGATRLIAALAAGLFVAVTLFVVGVEVESLDGGVRLTFGRPSVGEETKAQIFESEIRAMVRKEMAGGVGELVESVARRFGDLALRQEQRQVQFVRSARLQRDDDLRRTHNLIRRVAVESATESEQTRHLVEGLASLVRYADLKIPEIEH